MFASITSLKAELEPWNYSDPIDNPFTTINSYQVDLTQLPVVAELISRIKSLNGYKRDFYFREFLRVFDVFCEGKKNYSQFQKHDASK